MKTFTCPKCGESDQYPDFTEHVGCARCMRACVHLKDVKITDQSVSKKKISLSGTVEALSDSTKNVINIAADYEMNVSAIKELLAAVEAFDSAYLYLTDRSYKGRREIK
jgi:hypothetical protein